VQAVITKLLDDVITGAQTRCQIQSVEVTRHYDSAVPSISLDIDLIREAVANILDNALEAMRGPGRINFEVKKVKTENRIEIIITNTGSCPEAEIMKKIFDPFFTTKETGIGLGLAIAREVVESHGGKISVSADRAAQTTSFLMSFPIGG